MRLAGYPYDPATDSGGYPHEIRYLAVPDSFAQGAAEIYQQQLAKIGIRHHGSSSSAFRPTWRALRRRRTVAMAYSGWHADYADPSTFLEPNFATAAIQEEESMNMRVSSPIRVSTRCS